ncbi:protein tyrosine phosphatase family protein [Saccharospirillum salsuginis]|uniref:DSP-PTPase phosphatase fused to NAD+ Kinase domain-containing protein n=1 Tax=Saccharospirillum salsuginis TaxID=418750 RepID=A0A918NHY1_9GAMM|nr:protein tyrosine phosphatase family protein [Saccharospirillum salsuginis]GGX74299.1 hypothetical protein GCM10007392_47090 [Saccharospirillum salsuginis]
MEAIRNYVQLTENIATAGQPRADQFEVIADAGYQYIINLGMPNHPDAVQEEDKLISELGLGYIHIPVKFDSPTKEQVRTFCKVLSALKDQRVFIHCIMNFRVSAFMYHYLSKIERKSEVKSRSIMFDHWDLEPAWKNLMSWSSRELGLS